MKRAKDEKGGRVNINSVQLRNGKEVFPMVLNLVRQQLRRGIPPSVQYEDLVSEALYRMLDAQAKFRADKKAKLTTYAYLKVHYGLRDYQAKEQTRENRTILVEPNDMVHQPAPDGFVGHLNDRLLFLKVVELLETRLDPMQAVVLVRQFLEDTPVASIAKELRTTVRMVNKAREEGLTELRRLLRHECFDADSWQA